MLTTNELFDLIKDKHALRSDYQLAALLNVTPASISKHRCKPHGMDDALAFEVSKHLAMPPEYVLICAAAERAKRTEEKAAYLRLGAWIELRWKEIERGARDALPLRPQTLKN